MLAVALSIDWINSESAMVVLQEKGVGLKMRLAGLQGAWHVTSPQACRQYIMGVSVVSIYS